MHHPIVCGLFAALLLTSAALADDSPHLERDTLSPAYSWREVPFTWEEIRQGKLPVSPGHWQRDAGGPLVAPGMNARPLRWDEATIRVLFGRRSPSGGVFYFDVAVSQPNQLLAPATRLLAPGEKGAFDDDWAIGPELVRVSDQHHRIYYAAKQAGKAFFERAWSLGLAESFDGGQTWQKHEENPILQTTDTEWESGAVGFPSVLPAENGWRMWYLGTNQNSNAVKQVGLATSADGVHWQRHAGNPVFGVDPELHWEKAPVAVPRVIRDGPVLKMWYCCYPQNNTYAIGQAESFDGIHWYRNPHNPLLKGSGQGWDAKMTAYPGAIRAGDDYLMWYSGDGYGSKGIGLATAKAPSGKWFYRTGSTEKPDANWSMWQSVSGEEPTRAGFIQFAVLAD